MDRIGFRLINWQRGGTPGPWSVTAFPTWHCNIQCKICDKTWGGNPEEMLDEMSDERWLRLVDEAADLGVREFTIGGGGEPLLRHDLVISMLERVGARGMWGWLQTNGTCFRRGDAARLVAANMSGINISIDGPNAEINDAVRFRNDFRKATGAVRQLVEAKRAQGRKNPMVRVTTVITNLLYDKLDQMVAFVHELGGRHLHLLNLIAYNEHIADLALDEAQKAELPVHAARALARAEELGIDTNLADFTGNGYALQRFVYPEPCAPGTQIPLRDSACFEPWMSILVLTSGLVSPCCVFWDDDAPSVRDTSLRDVWLGQYCTDMRNRFLENRPHPKCAKCQGNLIWKNGETRKQLATFLDDDRFFSMAPTNILRKAASSLRQHGLVGSLRRGSEWLQLRSGYRRL